LFSSIISLLFNASITSFGTIQDSVGTFSFAIISDKLLKSLSIINSLGVTGVSKVGVIEVSAISFGSLFAVIVPIFFDKFSGIHSEVFIFILQFSKTSISIFLNHSFDHILV
jgi:hypothetical protein